MKTDTLFYRLFLLRPKLIFDLADIAGPENTPYSFQSVEIKQAAFRIDGIFIPEAAHPENPLIFAEVQYQKDPKIYARLFSEIALYLYQKEPLNDWCAVLIFPNAASDPGIPEHYRELFASGRIQRIYLNEMPKHAQGIGVQLIRLIEVDERLLTPLLADIKNTILANQQNSQAEWLDLLETILVYKLPRLSRDEVKAMLNDILNVELKQTRFYQDVFAEGLLEGKQEGRQEGEALLLIRQIKRRFGTISAENLKRLQSASPEQLEQWADNILDAASIEDVFIGKL
jgi:predicted transposase/invertase (TIGR01784 family)